MTTCLIRHADVLVTMDDAGTEIPDGAMLIEDGVIRQVGPTDQLPASADRVIDARNMVILPGLVNTHHHFFQNLTRAVPAAQQCNLFDWLKVHYPIWGGMTPDAVRTSTKTALLELLLSGCTTASDFHYMWPNGSRIDDQIEAATEMGMRFHASRGSMSLGESAGGLPPDRLVEQEDAIIRDSRRAIETYHDATPGAMIRIVLAPGSPFSVSPDLMRESLELARSYGVHSHTHLAETLEEDVFCREQFGQSPVEYCEALGWTGADVWHAHFVHPSEDEIARLGSNRTGAAHCPSSNMRLASGIANVGAWLQAGMRIGLGVDGSASNDGGHLLGEARQAMLLQRVKGDPAAMTARTALRLATRGGAEVLGRDDIGQLVAGFRADVVGFRMDTLAYAGGAVHDPVASLVFCQPQNVTFSMIEGRVRVWEGQPLDIDVPSLVARHNAIARALVRGEKIPA